VTEERWSQLAPDGKMDKLNESADAPSPTERRPARRDRSANVTQAVVTAVQSMIRDGTFKAGAALPPQRDLARKLGVSRASLREAVSILGALGQLSIEQGRGTFLVSTVEGASPSRSIGTWRFATRYSPEEVYQFRLIAESQAVQLAAMNHTDEELAELSQNLERFRQATRQADLGAYARADFDFHRLIIRFSRNRLLADMHGSFAGVLLEAQRLPLIRRDALWEPVVEHERIVESLKRSDPEGARYYMRQHLSRACSRAGLRIIEVI
jgi:GntR family transcriptional regulator, transcriptional repressor for pyruvate dehydrogenase complex